MRTAPLVWALNPDNGAVLWKADVAREIAGGRGETLFGGALDREKAYFGLISGAHLALDLKTGEELWYTPIVRPNGRENKRAMASYGAYIGSGYPGFQGGDPGNLLLAFAPAVRLDVHADQLKRRQDAGQGPR